MRVSTAATLALTALLVTSLVGAVAAAPSAPGADSVSPSTQIDHSPSESPALSPAVQSGSSADELPPADPQQVIRIAVADDGDTRWTIESRFLLQTEDDKETFRSYADAVTTGQRDVRYDRQTFVDFAREVQRSTGREMSIENESWDTSTVRPPEDEGDADETRIGVISYSFTWTNLATVDGERIYFGDAFQSSSGSGSWLGTFDEGMRLVIEPPENYDFEDAPTGLQNGNLVWDGPYQFDETELEIVFVRSSAGPGGSLSMMGWMIGAIAVLLVAAGSFAFARRSADLEADVQRIRGLVLGALGRDTDRDDATTPAATDTDSETRGPASAAEPIPDDAPDGADTHLEFEEEVDDGIDPELLSDEERVLRLLKRNGGRMKQASIVSETGWSNAKVSQLLSKMDDDEEIEKLRIGRENLITLPGVDPTEID